MEIELLTSSNNAQSTTLLMEPPFKNSQFLKSELYRLATFRSLKEKNPLTLSKGQLAKAGFCYIETEHKVKCEQCDFEIELSTPDIDVTEEHRKQSPQCQFVLAQHNLFPKTSMLLIFFMNLIEFNIFLNIYLDQQLLSLPTNISQTNVLNTNYENDMNDNANDQEDKPNPQKLFLNTLSKEVIDKIRANTFVNWPSITPNTQDMIAAGWSYTNIGDRVICIHCNILFHKWTESDRPYEIHRLRSPQCPFVLSAEKKAANRSASTITITTEPNTQAAVGAVNTTYALACRRYETFQKWPHIEENPMPSIESFVDAGFFYTGRI